MGRNFLYKIPSNLKEDEYCHEENIVKTAAKIFKKFKHHREVVTVAEMQSGKTEVMKRLIYLVNEHNNDIVNMGINISKYNIYIVICASSINLKKQIKQKLPENKHKVYHLNDIYIFFKYFQEYESLLITMSDSSLIIFDESHCDAGINKLIDKFRTRLESMSKENKTKYYKLSVSATPYEQIFAEYPKVIMKPGKNYYGIKQMFDTRRASGIDKGLLPIIFQAKNLANISECEELLTEIVVCNYYYIFRLPSNKNVENTVILNLEKQFRKCKSNIDSYIYDMNYKTNLNELLKIKPSKPTLIFIKDKLRMGEYLDTSYVYLVHDDPNNTYTHTTAQSLVGRCCGYNKQSHCTIIYCDYQKAYDHYKWIINNYDIKHIPPNAKYIETKNGTTKNCIY